MDDAAPMTVTPIGWVRSTRADPIDDAWDSETSYIELDLDVVRDDATAGLGAFSHLEVVYLFHAAPESAIERGARRPRGNPDWPLVGILAQRAKNRPNRLGVCCCRLLEVRGSTLAVSGLDAIDGTPVLDVKPYLAEFGPRGAIRQPDWSHELMKDYW
jgi:tRNA-Thr(GGU) m(6)t(6)A37 methyltransferase TsaA